MQLSLIIWFNYCIFQTKNDNYSNIFELDKIKLSIHVNEGSLFGLSMYLANHCESKKSLAPFFYSVVLLVSLLQPASLQHL